MFSQRSPTSDLELLTVVLQHNLVPTRICLSVFYRPPSTTSFVLDDLCTFFESVNCAQFANLVVVGDFNIDVATCSHPLYSKLCSVMATLSLFQMVNDYTHVHHNGTATTIDLLYASSLHLIRDCSVVPPLSNSDHCGLLASLSLKSPHIISKPRIVWRYSHADWLAACELLEAADWASILDPEDIEKSWCNWRDTFMGIMDACIPKAVLPQCCSTSHSSKEEYNYTCELERISCCPYS